jgi:hypothetical protein
MKEHQKKMLNDYLDYGELREDDEDEFFSY